MEVPLEPLRFGASSNTLDTDKIDVEYWSDSDYCPDTPHSSEDEEMFPALNQTFLTKSAPVRQIEEALTISKTDEIVPTQEDGDVTNSTVNNGFPTQSEEVNDNVTKLTVDKVVPTQ